MNDTDKANTAGGSPDVSVASLLPHHPACELFPIMSEKELTDLTEDICANGLQNDIITYESQILDGRCRQIACQRGDVEPRFRSWNGKGSPLAFVIAQNLQRRHLTRDQMTAVGVESLRLFGEEADGLRSVAQFVLERNR